MRVQIEVYVFGDTDMRMDSLELEGKPDVILLQAQSIGNAVNYMAGKVVQDMIQDDKRADAGGPVDVAVVKGNE